MNSEQFRIFLTVAMSLLLAGYLYLNSGKIGALGARLEDIAEGTPAREVALVASGTELLTFRVPSSDIFDSSGERQIVVQPVANATLRALKEQLSDVAVEYDGEQLPGRLKDAGHYLGFLVPGKKVYLVPEGNISVFAGVVASERRPAKPVIACLGDEFCRAVRITGASGVGPVQGPFLETEEDPDRRGLPRGRWGYGPASALKIVAERETRAVLAIALLQLPGDQRITFSDNVHVVRSGEGPHAGSGLLVPRSYLAELSLHPGENEVEMRYSTWWGPNQWTPRPLGAYIIKMQLAAAGVAGSAPRD